MKEFTEQIILNMWDDADEDLSTECLLQMCMDAAGVELDDVLKVLEKHRKQ